MSQDSINNHDLAEKMRAFEIRVAHQRQQQKRKTPLMGQRPTKFEIRCNPMQLRAVAESLIKKYYPKDYTQTLPQSPVKLDQAVQCLQSPLPELQSSDNQTVVDTEFTVFLADLRGEDAIKEDTRKGLQPYFGKMNGREVWTSKSFLDNVINSLKRQRTQYSEIKTTSARTNDQTSGSVCGETIKKVDEDTSEQVQAFEVFEVKSAGSESGTSEKRRQKKRAEKGEAKQHAFLQSLETADTFETTVDTNLLEELKQVGALLAANLTTTQALPLPAYAEELAAQTEARLVEWAACDAGFEEFYTKPWPTAKRPHGWSSHEASLRIDVWPDKHQVAISRGFISKWERILDVPLVYASGTAAKQRPPTEEEIVQLMSEVFSCSAENAVIISLHTTKQDLAARIYAEKVWSDSGAQGKLEEMQEIASERIRQAIDAKVRNLTAFNANDRKVLRTFGQKKGKRGPKGPSKPVALTENVCQLALKLDSSAADFIVEKVDHFWRASATLRLPTIIYRHGYKEMNDSFNQARESCRRLPANLPEFIQDVLQNLLASASRVARQQIRHQASRALSRLLALQLSRAYPDFYESFQGMFVSLTLFQEVKVSFRLDFKPKDRRTLGSKDFSQVRKTVAWLQDQVKQVLELATGYSQQAQQDEKVSHRRDNVCRCREKEKKQKTERIKKDSTKGTRGFECALRRLRDLLNGQDAQPCAHTKLEQEEEVPMPDGYHMTPGMLKRFRLLCRRHHLPARTK